MRDGARARQRPARSRSPACCCLTPARYYHPALFRWTVPHIAGGRRAAIRRSWRAQADARLAHAPSPLGYAFQLYAIAGWSSLPWLHRLRTPTLVVAGDDDPVIPLANARLMAHRIPDARLHVVRGGGHLFLLDEPESAVGRDSGVLEPLKQLGGDLVRRPVAVDRARARPVAVVLDQRLGVGARTAAAARSITASVSSARPRASSRLRDHVRPARRGR